MKIKKYQIILGISILFMFNTYKVSADVHVTTSILSQIENAQQPDTEDLNDDGARNWLMSNGKPCVQKTDSNKEITYKIDTKNSYFKRVWVNAIQNWNSLNVIKLIPSSNKQEITLTTSNNKTNDSDYYAITHSDIDKKSANNNKLSVSYLKNTKASLNDDLKSSANYYDFNVKTATHELGHALGFEHDDSFDNINNKYYIMHDGSGPLFSKNIQNLGQYEKQTLMKYYK